MDRDELIERTMQFALRVVKMSEVLPKTTAGRTAAGQIVRSATSVAANYRASQRAKSRADFVSKIATVLEEADETEFWLEFIARAELLLEARLAELRAEADELTRIFAAIRRSARRSV